MEDRIRQAAVNLYRSEIRAKQIIDMCVARAMQESGEPDERDFRRFAHDVAREATLTLLSFVYENDAELQRLREECARYKQLAEQGLRLQPMRPLVISDSGRLPEGENAEGG